MAYEMLSKFDNFRNFLLQLRFLNNATNTSKSHNLPGLSDNYHTQRIYLLIIDLIIFIIFTYLCHGSYKKFSNMKHPNNPSPEELNTIHFRITFVKGLIVANGSK